MRARSILATTLVLLLVPALATARDLTLDQVLSMKDEGFDDSFLIKMIEQKGVAFEITTELAIDLKSKGVSQAVIEALLETHTRPEGRPPGEQTAGKDDASVAVSIAETGTAPVLSEEFFSVIEDKYSNVAVFSTDPPKRPYRAFVDEDPARPGNTLFWVRFSLHRVENVHVRTLGGRDHERATLLDTEGGRHPLKSWRAGRLGYLDSTSLTSPMKFLEGAEGILVFEVPEAVQPVSISFVYYFTRTWEKESDEKAMPARLELGLP